MDSIEFKYVIPGGKTVWVQADIDMLYRCDCCDNRHVQGVKVTGVFDEGGDNSVLVTSDVLADIEDEAVEQAYCQSEEVA